MKKIIVFQQHTHEGITYPAGTEITLPDTDAKWLIEAEGARRAQSIKETEKAHALLKSLKDK
ncbi:MAG: DUF7210 family protein [Burkholderiales bacterium]